MFQNKRQDLSEIIKTIGSEKGVKSIRVYNKQGYIIYSSDTTELMKKIDFTSEACIVCHSGRNIADNIIKTDSIRNFRINDERVLGLINPIRNEPDCYNADCHAHPKSNAILGVLDVVVSLKYSDAVISQMRESTIINSILITIFISGISGIFILFLVNKPIRRLQEGIERLGKGEWNFRIVLKSKNELGIIAREFNDMSRKLSSAYNEIKNWSDTLNEKVTQKTEELKNIYEQIVQVEKLASLGKLSATVAHELNNPLEGILTFSKLIAKKLKNATGVKDSEKIINYLNLIAEESARCGKIVKDLLLFAHRENEEFIKADIVEVIEKSLLLVNHHLEINHLELKRDFSNEIPEMLFNPQKIQQALISLLINSIESMQGKGKFITISLVKEDMNVIIRISDEGSGIAKKDLPHIFEPFYSTKDNLKGTGLGLAVVYGIIKLHNGKIEVESTSGSGTTFKITLPCNQ